MKNIKLYRAGTMREALKIIKDEMGEDALAISHKEVQAGGIFGLDSKKMIEVKVAVENGSKKNEGDKSAKASRPSGLNMIDDAPALASTHVQTESEKSAFSPSAFKQQYRQSNDYDLEIFDSPYCDIYNELMCAGLTHVFALQATRASMQIGARLRTTAEDIALAAQIIRSTLLVATA